MLILQSVVLGGLERQVDEGIYGLLAAHKLDEPAGQTHVKPLQNGI